MLVVMSSVTHARFVPLHCHDQYLTFAVDGMCFDESNAYIIRYCVVQVFHSRCSSPYERPISRGARRSPNHITRVVDTQSPAEVSTWEYSQTLHASGLGPQER